jgi:carbonic anhydrase/acetyltransferase-like protein (isoleucine patch superfamily)
MLLREAGKAWRLLLGLPNTLRFNFRYFSFAQACKLPVLVSHRMKLVRLDGSVELAEYRFGSVRLGPADVDVFPDGGRPGVWRVEGRVRLGAGVRIGPGTSIVCTGDLDIGDHVLTNARVSLYCAKQIVIGRDTLISWDATIIDHDFHELRDADNNCINPPAAIIIGERAWIGFGATIAKETRLAAGTVIGAGAVVRGEFNDANCVLSGNPARLVRRGVYRDVSV